MVRGLPRIQNVVGSSLTEHSCFQSISMLNKLSPKKKGARLWSFEPSALTTELISTILEPTEIRILKVSTNTLLDALLSIVYCLTSQVIHCIIAEVVSLYGYYLNHILFPHQGCTP